MANREQSFTLPNNFNPKHYEISLSRLDHEKRVFVGHVKIDFKCQEPSERLYLNVKDLSIDNVEITLPDGGSLELISREFDTAKEAFILTMAEPITCDFSASIDYRGVIQTNMSGFYRSNYTDIKTNEEKFMLSTQFEATDARAAFPCIDEPDRKATFKVSITVQGDCTVLSNMPEESAICHGSETTHLFHTTPLMSTYLVAWAVGEYEYIESKTEKQCYPTLDQYSIVDGSSASKAALPIRIYTAVGKRHQGKFALSVATKAVDLFLELFKIPYPLPKLDLVCVESYSHNAMENFSLITFRPTALLVECDAGGEGMNTTALEKVAYVVCHEIAHQWFGNLVTMRWWDELWLNEGFATWVGWHAVSVLFPDWDVDSIVMLRSHEVALQLDALRESHPVKVEVRDPKDIDQVFDTISYLKGCSVLEMVSGYLGEKNFLAGVALYLQRNKWGNATMDDLFNCLREVSKVEILANVKPWLLEAGYPLLTVTQSKDKLLASQRKYHINDDGDTAKTWWVPLLLTRDEIFLQKLDFTSRTIELEAGSKLSLFNTGGAAFYRVNYESPELIMAICDNITKLSSRSKMSLVADVYALQPLPVFLHLVSRIMQGHDPSDVYPWKTISSCLTKLRSVMFDFSSTTSAAKFDRYILQLIDPWVDQALSYFMDPEAFKAGNDDAILNCKSQFYGSILMTAGKLSHPKVVQTMRNLFSNGNVNAFNRAVVLGTILSQPDTTRNTFDQVLALLDTAVLEEMETILRCLGSVTNRELFEPCLELLFKIEPMNVQFLPEGWIDNPRMHPSILLFANHHRKQLIDRLGVNQVVIGRFVSSTFAYFQGMDAAQQIKSIFKGYDVSAYDRILKQTLEKVEINTRYFAENMPSLEIFLK